MNVLVAGETWIKQAIHIREFDEFHIIEYEKGAGAFLECLVAAGHALWPPLLSYNRLLPKPGCVVAARTASDLMLVTGEYGERRAVAFASDLAPHWAPPEFVDWVHYPALWTSIPAWAVQAAPDAHATGRRGSWS